MPFDPGWILVFVIIGYFMVAATLRKRHARMMALAEAGKPKPPICGCDHHLVYHSKDHGRCTARVRTPVSWIRNPELDRWISGDEQYRFMNERPTISQVPDRWELVPCDCQRYIGPEPLGAELFSQDLTLDYVEPTAAPEPPGTLLYGHTFPEETPAPGRTVEPPAGEPRKPLSEITPEDINRAARRVRGEQ